MSLLKHSTERAAVLALAVLLVASGCSQPAVGSAAPAAEEPAPLVEVVRVRTASDALAKELARTTPEWAVF